MLYRRKFAENLSMHARDITKTTSHVETHATTRLDRQEKKHNAPTPRLRLGKQTKKQLKSTKMPFTEHQFTQFACKDDSITTKKYANGGDTQSRNLRNASFLHGIFVQVQASSCTRKHAILTLYNKLSTTSQNKMKTVAAIGSRPIRAHHSSHVHASFLYGIELCCIRCKKLVQEKSCIRNHVRRSSFLFKFLVQVS